MNVFLQYKIEGMKTKPGLPTNFRSVNSVATLGL